MPTRQELEQIYKTEHDRITKEYYQDKTLSKALFESQHMALTVKLEDELVAIGAYVRPPVPPLPINYKALWLAADTIAKKLAVLAKRLEME